MAIDPLLENSLPRPRGRRRQRRTPSRMERWGLSPIVAYRVGLTSTYVLTIGFGIIGLIAGIPAFTDGTAPRGYVVFWAIVVIIGAIIATVGSVHSEGMLTPEGPTRLQKIFRNIELVGAWLLFAAIGSYAAVLLVLASVDGDVDRAAGGAGFVVLGAQPGWRMIWLMAQLGRR